MPPVRLCTRRVLLLNALSPGSLILLGYGARCKGFGLLRMGRIFRRLRNSHFVEGPTMFDGYIFSLTSGL
jgi:hypothetical protein